MGAADFYLPGAWNMCDDRTGFKIKNTWARKEWNNIWTHTKTWEARHEQDFLRSIPDKQAVYDPRPECEEIFVTTTIIQDDDGVAVPESDVTFAITVTSEDVSDDTPTQAATIHEEDTSDDTGTFTITLAGDALKSTNTASVTLTLTGTADDTDFTTTRMAALSAGASAAGVTFVDNLDDTALLTWDIDSSLSLDAVLTAEDDATNEGSETSIWTLSAPVIDNGTATIVSGKSAATLTILDSDGVIVVVKCFTIPETTGLVDWTTTDLGGLTPKAVQFIIGGGWVAGTRRAHLHAGIGFADGTSEYLGVIGDEDANSSTNTFRRCDDDRCIGIMEQNQNSLRHGAVFSSFIEDGVRLNFDIVGGQPGVEPFKVSAIFYAGNDLSAKCWEATMSTQDTEVDITGIGFEPNMVQSLSVDLTTFTQANDTQFPYGVAVNDGVTVTNAGIGWNSKDTRIETGVAAVTVSNRLGAIPAESGPAYPVGGFAYEAVDFDADGFSIATRITDSNNAKIFGLALDLGNSSAWVSSFTSPSSTGSFSQTGVGFTPKAVGFGMTYCPTVDVGENDADAGSFGISVFDSFGNACSQAYHDEDAADPTVAGSLHDTVPVHFIDGSGTQSHLASFTSMDSDGYTLDFTVTDARAWFAWAIG